MSQTLISLPPELLIRILCYLPLSSLTSCLLTCKSLYTLITTSTILQYLIELESTSTSDNPLSPFSLSEKLSKLRARSEAWRKLSIAKTVGVRIKHRPSGIYDFTGGVYLLGVAEVGSLRPTKGLKYVELPSLDDGEVKSPEWKSIEVGEDIIDIGLALREHDLLAVVAYHDDPTDLLPTPLTPQIITIHLLQFSASSTSSKPCPHPLASQPVLFVCKVMGAQGHCSLGIEIVGDTLALLLTFPYSGPTTKDWLYIWDWKKGYLKATYDADWMTYTTLAFLSEHVLLLPNLTTQSLDLVPIPPTASYPTSSYPPAPTRLRTSISLGLPPLKSICTIIRMACRAEPNPLGAAYYESKANSGGNEDTQGFHDAPEDAILIFNMLIQDTVPLRFGHVSSVSFVVHRSSLLRYFRAPSPPLSFPPLPSVSKMDLDPESQSRSSSPEDPPCPTLDFPLWGPPATRWFLTDNTPTRWITTTCGQRYVSVLEDNASPIVVRDFGRLAVKKMEGVWKEQKARRERRTKEEKRREEEEMEAWRKEEELKLEEERLKLGKVREGEWRKLEEDGERRVGEAVFGVFDEGRGEGSSRFSGALTEEGEAAASAGVSRFRSILARLAPSSLLEPYEEEEDEDDEDGDTSSTFSSYHPYPVYDPDRMSISSTMDSSLPGKVIDIGGGKKVRLVTERTALPVQLYVGGEEGVEVWSELGYVESVSEEEYDYAAVLMDEERIIGMTFGAVVQMDENNDRVTGIDILLVG
ncbi:hypothetical protein JAAARDRAFT_36902 [Jaapia argillacea MUCL 33604]|uniref:F-box domain-containing protein n=1 Tax=Jaapia argillacea MUCL 33604 TaxID=933084 RepID=A0A067PMV3_9AGAM|nr:hypothetical protein JAAARDRAFT_36902 [Jaapia argillacea MUCL 33604]